MIRKTSLTKISRPSPSGVFARKRLFRLLDDARQGPVIWITGPAGSGKTSLITSYLEHRSLPYLWYHVDEGDGDPATFFYYLGKAADGFKGQKPLPLLTPEYLHEIRPFARIFFEGLCERLYAPFAIVFDNYHEVPSESPFHDAIREGLAKVPEGVTVMVISRSDPPADYARLLANAAIKVIGWNDLRFDVVESKDLVRLRCRKKVSPETLHHLHSTADGWAAGLVLLTERLNRKSMDPASLSTHVPEEIFDFFAGEVLDKTDQTIREFLLRTAFFHNITAGMAGALTGMPHPEKILSDLAKRNYFTHKYLSNTKIYEYHSLFRRFLISRAEESIDPESLLEIKYRAAEILEENGQSEAAVLLYNESKQCPDVERLILEKAPDMIAQGRGQTLEAWIRLLPDGVIGRNPWILYWMGACRLPFSPAESYHFFDRAALLFNAFRNASGIFLCYSGMSDAILYGFDSFKHYDSWISEVYDAIGEYRSFPSPEVEARMINGMLSAMTTRRPEHHDFECWAERALFLLKKIKDITLKVHILLMLGFHRLFSGELAKAELIIASFQKIAASTEVTPLAMLMMKDLEAFFCWASAKFDGNRAATDEGLRLASDSGIHVVDVFLAGHGAAGALSNNDLKRADELFERIAPFLEHGLAWGRQYHHLLLTWKALLEGDFLKASLEADFVLKLIPEVGMAHTEAVAHLGKAIALHGLRKKNKAKLHLEEAHKICSSVKLLQVEFGCHLAEAQFAVDYGHESAAIEPLRKAMLLGGEQKFTNTYFWRPAVISNLCVKALESGIEKEYVRELVRKRNLIPESPPLHCDDWPWELKIFTLGGFSIQRLGRTLNFPARAERKPMELFKALIAFGGTGITESQLSDALWPSSDGDKAHQAFATTLYRLRQLIGNEKALRLSDGRLSLEPRCCWVDAYAFEFLHERAEALFSTTTKTEIDPEEQRIKFLRLTEKAMLLYKGPFMGEETNSWAIQCNERLRSKFLRVVRKLGTYWEKEGEWEKAVEAYLKGLEIDALAEDFYQRVMICYLRLSRKAQAIAIYNRCRKTLQSVLGIEPSSATKTIYKAILS